MSQIPTCGRIVHFFPNAEKDAHIAVNGADRVPAIVIQAFTADRLNLVIFPMNVDSPVVLRYSVPHKSYAENMPDTASAMSYWDWPEIVKSAKVVDLPLPYTTTRDGISGDAEGGQTYKQFSEENRA